MDSTPSETEDDLRREIQRLRQQLHEASRASGNSDAALPTLGQTDSTITTGVAPPEKSGYLFKWQDRTIGWGGTKWALRYVRLNHGQLSYYKSHEERSPRYIMTLKNCAVRDEGSKVNKRHGSAKNGESSDHHAVGSRFYVFSVYRRVKNWGDSDAQYDNEDDIIPLLRFSTQSLAEKILWVDLISESCAYCDSEEFALYHQQQQEIQQKQQEQQIRTEKGTLPALVFEAPRLTHKRLPSGHKLNEMGKSFRKKSVDKDAARSNKISYPPSKPMHRQSNPSYLSDGSHVQNYRGLFNLLLLILVLSNFRLLLDTVAQHGFILDKLATLQGFSQAPLDFPFVSGLLIVQAFVVGAYAIEKMLSVGLIGNQFGMLLHVINSNATLGVVMAIVWYLIDQPFVGAGLIMQATITWLKLISYAHANYDYRTSPDTQKVTVALVKDLDDGQNVSYPQNVTLKDIYYFWLAPTLTYQIAFPRSPFIRWPKVFSLTLQLFISVTLAVFLCAQVVAPNLDSLVKNLEANKGEVRTQQIFDYLLKLSITSTYIWLLGFYGFFHCFMNLAAELLRFGDRGERTIVLGSRLQLLDPSSHPCIICFALVFYRDWWNASEVSAYWRLWNMPVHYWLVRHVYFPCIRVGMSKKGATFVVFFFSAVLHEVLISVPCHMIRVSDVVVFFFLFSRDS